MPVVMIASWCHAGRPRFTVIWLLALAALAAATVALGAAASPARAVGPAALSGPLVQFIDTNEREDATDISIEFSCSVRYVGNVPASYGDRTKITLKLGADCGAGYSTIAPELPLVGGGGKLVTGARLDSMVPGEVTLELTWSRPLDFVIAPTASGLGLRVRLLTGLSRPRAKVFIAETESPAGYAINLDSAQTPFERDTVEQAAAALQAQAFVSEIDIEEQHWYRLRVGPFTTRSEAERVLAIAQAKYPHAWLAVNDEQIDLAAVEHAGVQPTAAAGPTDPPLPDEQRKQMLRDARVALAKHQYAQATDLLSRLLRQPEYPARAEAQELLGLTRERAGQLAQAKAEYGEYLRRYPNGPAAARVRSRLQALAAASLSPQATGEFGAGRRERWTLAGSAALSYQYGKDQTTSTGTTTTTNSLSTGLAYADLLLRDRGDRYDFTARVNAGYTHNFVSANGGSQDRATAAYVEMADKMIGLTGRVGRQSLASQGVIGLFDGLYVGYHANSKLSVGAAAGIPAYTSYSSPSSHQRFGTLTTEYDPFHQTLVFDGYFFNQTNDGATERRSIGLQTRYSQSGRTAVMLVDYDISFRQLNSVTLIGNARIGQQWTIGFDADHRRSPLLQLSNALVGQNVATLSELEGLFTPSQIRQIALDRTATSDTFVLSATRSFGVRWQFTTDVSAEKLNGTPASFGVPATQSTGIDKAASVQLAGSSLLQANDLHIFSARFDDSPSARSETLSWDARFALHGAWRLGPRLSVERLDNPDLGGRQMLYLPQIRGDWTNRFSVFELIAGYQFQNQQTLLQPQTPTGEPQLSTVSQRSLFLSAAYRVRF